MAKKVSYEYGIGRARHETPGRVPEPVEAHWPQPGSGAAALVAATER